VLITTPDDRTLQVVDAGGDGLPCVFHSGTPGGPLAHDAAMRAAADAGLRWITYGRPGYGDSTPFPDRPVVQAARDTATVLDHLGLDTFVTYGWSGGGPHALACAAVLPGRCLAAATLAGVAPFDAVGLDFTAGMGPENVEEFGLAVKGRAALTPYLLEQRPGLLEVTADDIAASLGGLISKEDRASLTGEFAAFLAASFREAVRVGVTGWLDDDLAFVSPWGFAVESITVPVAIWQGEQDLMVPFAHGQWLASHIPRAQVHLLPDHGHLSLTVGHLPAILAELRDQTRVSRRAPAAPAGQDP
jgi:pimeloyl-ACP methyl ester carboxylesterase